MPRPKKPHAFKLISGSRRVERGTPSGVQLPPLEVAPPPPEWLLDDAAVEEWNRLASLLVANRMVSDMDLGTLAHLCAVHGQIVACYLAGITPKGSLVGVYASMSAAFGLTPATRSKAISTQTGTTANPFRAFVAATKR